MKYTFRVFVILCAILVSGESLFGQTADAAPEEIELLPYLAIFQTRTVQTSVEKKRDALLELRNFRTAEASRIAVPALLDDSEIVRATATATVVFLPPFEAAQSLIPLLADKKPFVRREAAAALGKVGDSIAVNPLLRVLQADKIAEVRNAAVNALGSIGDAAAVGALTAILRRKSTAKTEFARRSAARSIGQIAQILQTGEIVVLTPESFLPNQLESIEPPKYPRLNEAFPQFRPAVDVLIQTLRDPAEPPDVRREAAFALGAVGDAAATAVLQTNVSNEDYYLAEICRESLRKIAAAAERLNAGKI